MLSFLPSLWTAAILFVGLTAAYNIALVIYRLYFHPLKDFPGPKLNAATLWVDFYYDAILEGQLTFKLKDWHDQYGPIVRISPDELHILDPEYYEDIYTSAARPRDKWQWITRSNGFPGAGFNTSSHEHHRIRRGLLNPYFSKKTILEDALPIARAKLAKLLHRLRVSTQTGDVIRMDTAFMALSMDIITSYTLDMETDYLGKEDFERIWQESIRAGFSGTVISHHFNWFNGLMRAIPTSVMLKLIPLLGHFLLRRDQVRVDVEEVWYEDEKKTKLRDATTMPRRSMIHTMRDADHLPSSERHPERVVDETFVLLGAGSETTARTLGMTSYYLLTNPAMLANLREELKTLIPAGQSILDIPYAVLENSPYLSAVVSEGLRTSHGVISRLPRLVAASSNEKLKYKDWEIPKSAVISMSGYYVITDPHIFPEPLEFRPERWLLANSDADAGNSGRRFNVAMNRYLTNFGKGSRSCLGINLAYAEIYLTLAVLAVHVLGPETEIGMELYEVDFDRDVKLAHDFFTGFAGKDSKGVRMRSGKANKA